MVKSRGLVWFVLIIISFALVACLSDDQSSNESNSSSKGKEGTATSEQATDEVITLKFFHWYSEGVANWEEVIGKYEAENPSVKIESIQLGNFSHDYMNQLDLLASTGEEMDLIMFPNPVHYVKRIDAGLISPIDSYLEDEGVDVNSEYNNSYGAVDGKFYGLPMKKVANLIMINKSHLDEAGLDIPTEWTWDDYREYAKAMTTDEHYGSYLHSWHQFHSLLKLLGNKEHTSLLNEDGNSNLDDPLVRESLELRYQLEQEDKSSVPFSDTISQKLNYRQQFFSGQASMIPTGSFMITEWGEFTPDFEIAWAPWPKNTPDSEVITRITGDVIAMAESSEHKQEAYDFMRWLSTEGISEQGIWIPAWKGEDIGNTLEILVNSTSNPEAIHMESLEHTLSLSNLADSFVLPSYSHEVYREFGVEADLYLLGQQDIDTTVENVEERVQSLILISNFKN